MDANGVRVYGLCGGWRLWAIFCLSLGLPSVGLPILALGSLLLGVPGVRAIFYASDTSRATLWLPVAVLALLLGWSLVRQGRRLLTFYLVVSAKGLDYHRQGRHTHVRWHELARYGPVDWEGPWSVDGVLVRYRPGEGIPLGLFAADWPVSPLGQTIQHYALRLTSPPASAASAAPPRRRNHRAPGSVVPAPAPPRLRSAITRRLRPLHPSGDANPGEWQGTVTGRLEEQDGDTVRF